jgi:hypothetical protein
MTDPSTPSSNLVARLRNENRYGEWPGLLLREAADTIERLTRERDEARKFAQINADAVDALQADRQRLRAALERAERVAAMANALPVTTEELRRIRNAPKIDRVAYALTSCLIDMREALGPEAETTPSPNTGEPK